MLNCCSYGAQLLLFNIVEIRCCVQQEELRALFEPHCPSGIADVHLQSGKGFAFVTPAEHHEAMKAQVRTPQIADLFLIGARILQREIDGQVTKSGAWLRIRFSTSKSKVWVGQIPPMVSNEQLQEAFSTFGVVDEAWVACDDHGSSKGHGWVVFQRKHCAAHAIAKCTEGMFLLGEAPRPIRVREYRDLDPLGVKGSGQRQQELLHPRFPQPGSPEVEMASKWRSIDLAEDEAKREIAEKFEKAREMMLNEEQVWLNQVVAKRSYPVCDVSVCIVVKTATRRTAKT